MQDFKTVGGLRVGWACDVVCAELHLMLRGSFGPYKMESLLDQHECMNHIWLKASMSERDGVLTT